MYSIWTRSYIKCNGNKVYLETPYEELKEKMSDHNKEIEVEVSGIMFSKCGMFQKEKISEYGEAVLI